MPSVLLNAEKEIAADAAAVLKFLSGAEKKIAAASPAATAGLGVLLGGVAKALTDVQSAAGNPLVAVNVEFDAQTFQDFVAVWPEIKALALTLGIKL